MKKINNTTNNTTNKNNKTNNTTNKNNKTNNTTNKNNKTNNTTNKTTNNTTNKNNKTNNTTNNKTRKTVFKKEHYNANDGFLTTTWGPPLWHYLHTMSFNYPTHPTPEDKIHYLNFILQLEYVLPCKYCRINLKKNFIQLPLTMKNMKNRESFSRYIYELHELVNKMLNKESGLTYKDVRDRYENFRSRCFKNIIKAAEKEKGCTESLYGKKSKCIIKIVPQEDTQNTFQIDEKCIVHM